MRINGEWRVCDDDVVRPVIHAAIQAADGTWLEAPFLVDTGADCTAFSSRIARVLNLAPYEGEVQLGGVGGAAESVIVETKLQLLCDDGRAAFFRGQFAAFHSPFADICLLGRDILGSFAVIVDQPGDVVCLIGQRHRYEIVHD
jgi:hypothetical protein